MRCVRVHFTKTGRMIYVSHLDVNRMMTRAVRRAELPMWYTEGFNPHPYIAFALPLSLGQSSECEFMDIKIETDMTNEEIKKRLSPVMPEGVRILSVGEPDGNINEITAASYSVNLEFASREDAERFYSGAISALDGDELMAEKMGKKGHRKVLKQVNLIEQIYERSLSLDGCYVNLELTVAAGNTVNLNPALLTETLEKQIGIIPESQKITRTGIIFKGE